MYDEIYIQALHQKVVKIKLGLLPKKILIVYYSEGTRFLLFIVCWKLWYFKVLCAFINKLYGPSYDIELEYLKKSLFKNSSLLMHEAINYEILQ